MRSLALLLVLLATTLNAQTYKATGFTQVRVGYAPAAEAGHAYHSGLKRARLIGTASFDSGFEVRGQVSGSASLVRLLDATVAYRTPALGGKVGVRVGRMFSAARPAAFNAATRVDAIDRPSFVGRWAKTGIGGDGRDFGIEATYRSARVEAALFVHRGYGVWTHRPVSSAAVSGRFDVKPARGLRAGLFASYNPTHSPYATVDGTARRTLAYAGHVYYGERPGSQRVRVKLDLLATRYLAEAGASQASLFGGSVSAAYRFAPSLEIVGQTERTVAFGAPTRAHAAGLTWSLSAMKGEAFHRRMLSLGYRTVNGTTNLTAQIQVAF
ncbi:MAG: hypothetical protein AAGI08_12100 [Bacteroidota bacterium]